MSTLLPLRQGMMPTIGTSEVLERLPSEPRDAAMPRYVFTVQNSKPDPDTVEVDLADPQDARSMAMAEAGEMLRDHQTNGAWPTDQWWVHVADEQGTTVCRLTVSGS